MFHWQEQEHLMTEGLKDVEHRHALPAFNEADLYDGSCWYLGFNLGKSHGCASRVVFLDILLLGSIVNLKAQIASSQ